MPWPSTSTAAGIREKRPETDDEWDELEHRALAIAEAVNLVKMPDRPMANKGEMNVDPEGPELPPAEIAARVKRTARSESIRERAAGCGRYSAGADPEEGR